MFELFNSVDSVYNIASQVIPDIKVVETQGSPTGVSCQIKDNVPTIMWDVDFWDYIEQNVFLRDTLPYDGEDDTKIITEYFYNYHGIQAYHLSKRYAAFPQIRAAFIEYANKYNYSYFKELYPKAVEVSEFRYDCELEVMAFKLMALYHELAHLLFRRDPDMKDNFEDMVISNVKEYIARFGDLLFSSVSDSDYIPERVTGDYLKYISNQFVDRNEKYVNLIEEMAADTYAVSKTHATIFRNADRSNCIGASDAILSGISIFYSQISNYETVCSFWDTIIPQVILKVIMCRMGLIIY